jgi:hypothetical protein
MVENSCDDRHSTCNHHTKSKPIGIVVYNYDHVIFSCAFSITTSHYTLELWAGMHCLLLFWVQSTEMVSSCMDYDNVHKT